MPKVSKPYSRLEGMAEHLTDVRVEFGAEPDPERGLPDIVRPFKSRPVFLILGMYGSGASLVAQMLQLLGVDMVEGEPANDDRAPAGAWERPEIVNFNDRLLEALGRPLNSNVHALPFAAGWWMKQLYMTRSGPEPWRAPPLMFSSKNRHCRIIRLIAVPNDFRPTAPERTICTKFRSIFPLSITRGKTFSKSCLSFVDRIATSSAGMSFM